MSEALLRTDEFIRHLLRPNLEAKGYEVFFRPLDSILPPFLQGTRPDAIALKGDEKIVIAMVPGVGEPGGKIPRLNAALADHPDWQIKVFNPSGRTEELTLPIMSQDAIAGQLDRLLDIYDASGPIPALLMGWALLEAAARLLMPEVFSRRQTQGSLMESLAFEGWVTPDEAAMLRPLGRVWNRAAHGDLEATATREEIAVLAEVVRTLLGLVETANLSSVETSA